MANKQNQLVQAILEQNQSLNATQLANRLGVSVRTVHNYLNKINSEYPGGDHFHAGGLPHSAPGRPQDPAQRTQRDPPDHGGALQLCAQPPDSERRQPEPVRPV